MIIVQNESLGLAIDCDTATAHWHAERTGYDGALMVAMASRDSPDTRPEAGPAAGDWNAAVGGSLVELVVGSRRATGWNDCAGRNRSY